ncbi:MAG: heparinase II/III family protein [Candidatus Krumholzibacteriia bacterium]
MRGLGRLRRAGRRLRGSLARPPRVAAPAAALAAAGCGDVIRLRAAFRPVHDEATLAAIARDPAADCGLSGLAAGLREGRLPVFDHALPPPLLPDWSRVPGGGQWPRMPAGCYDHADFTAHGDVRQLWELGRLQALPTLAAAARLDAAQADATCHVALALLADFRARNPVGFGPHWIAGLESGLRIFSLLWTWQLLPAAQHTEEFTQFLAAALLENGRFTAAHLSEKTVANNHLLGEAAALYCLGCALPSLPESAAWRARGAAILDRELPLQVLGDGVLAEQAVDYHRFVLDFLVQCLLWGRAADDAAATAWRPVAAAMLPPLTALTAPDGQLLAWGDDDTGRVLRLDARPRRDARPLLALGARLLQVDLGPLGAPTPDGEALWLGGAAVAAATPPDGAGPPTRFAEAGWHCARFGEAVGAAGLAGGHLGVKAGPMGRGGAGHGHADALALDLAFGGRPLLVDPGTYLYNGPQRWRDHFRGAAAHSLLRVGRRDPATPLPPPDRFGWERKSRAVLVDSPAPLPGALLDWTAWRRGDRDAAGAPVGVCRRVVLLAPDLLLVVDAAAQESGASASLDLELHWQAAPGLAPIKPAGGQPSARCEATGLVLRELTLGEGGAPRLALYCFVPAALDSEVQIGQEEAPAGWVSPSYGEREPATHWRLAGSGSAPAFCLSLLADPAGRFRGCRLANGDAPGAFRLEIAREGADTRKMDLAAPDPLGGPEAS